MRVLSLIVLGLLVVGLTVLVGRGVRRGWRKHGRYKTRRVFVVLGVVFYLYWVIVPVVVAIVATSGSGGPAVALDLGRGTEQVTIETEDGLTLAGSYVPSRNGAAVVTYPSREWTEAESKMLAEQGFGVLALDMRGYGGSDGDRNAYGWGSTPDIDAGVAYLRQREGVDQVGGFGSSVGGEQMIEAAASNENLSAVVSEGAGERSVKEMLIRGPAAALAIPQALVLTGSVALLSGESPPPALDDLAARISPRALMLINSANGTGGEELNTEYFAAAGEPKELWTVSTGGHTEGLASEPEEFTKRVTDFYNEHLDADPSRTTD